MVSRLLRAVSALSLVALVTWPATVEAVPFQYDLQFQTSGQSLWDTGNSFTLDKTNFIGAAWQDQTTGVNLIAGSETTNLPNPLRVAYDASFAACRGLGFSSSACINGQSARPPVVGLGRRPSVRSCGRYAFACKARRLGDLSRRAAYDAAFAVCRRGFSSSVCRNGQSARLPVVALGAAPPQFLNVDTRTGVAVEGTTDGRVGLELGVAIDSGSVEATVSYQANLDIPDTTGLDKANAINFNPNSALAGLNTLDTSFSSLELTVDAILEVSGSVTGEACIIGAGCTVGSSPFDIDGSVPVASFNKNGDGEVLVLGLPPSTFGAPPAADGFPLSVDAGVAEVTFHLPQPDATGGLDAATETLKATGKDDLIDVLVDVDGLVVPGGLGRSVPIGTVGSVGFDIIDVKIGPTVDLQQDFELTPTLFVNLAFDTAVMIGGDLVTELTSAWDLLPDITFLSDVTTVTPTFFLEADLLNETLLDFDLEFIVDLLQVNFAFLGFDETFGVGNVLALGADLFQSPNLYENLFPLLGFNLQIGDSFVVDFASGAPTLPDSPNARGEINEIILIANPDTIPEPGTAFLFIAGLGGLILLRRRWGKDVPLTGARLPSAA